MSRADVHYGFYDGKLRAGTFAQAVKSYPQGTQLEFTVRKAIDRRTSPQNRYFHGVVLAIASNAIRELGTSVTNEEIKEMWKRLFSPVDVMVSKDGEVAQLGKPTHEMEVDEFVAFTDRCVAWCAERGIHIPAPGEQTEMDIA
jgi:hypothetical protein